MKTNDGSLQHKRHYTKILLGLAFLVFPALNLIDIFPDCVAYFILAYAISAADGIVPYVSETRERLMKLGMLTLIRIPAMALMYANMAYGRDIVVLFTFVFNVAEVALLILTVRDGFNAIYHLGERTDASALVRPFKLFGREMRVESLQIFTVAFVIIRAVLNTVPSFFLLTYSDVWQEYYARRLYAPVEITFMCLSLIIGIVWYIAVTKYVRAVKRQHSVYNAVVGIVDKGQLAKLRRKRRVKADLVTLVVLAASSLFTFELAFDNFNGVNILPHFIYGIILLFCAYRLFGGESSYRRMWLCGMGYIIASIVSYIFSIRFLDSYGYDDLAGNDLAAVKEAALAAYLPYEICTVIETVFLLAFITLFALSFRRYILANTGIDPRSSNYGRMEKEYHTRQCVLSYLLFGLMALIGVCKCANVFFHASIKQVLVYVEGAESSAAVVAEPLLPWFGTLIFTLSLALVVFSFIYLMAMREDVRMRHSITDDSLDTANA